MLERIAVERRAILSIRGATFAVDSSTSDDPEAFLTTIRFRSRDKMAPIERHVVDSRYCGSLSSAGICTEQLGDNGESTDVPLAVATWHRYRACAKEMTPCAMVDKDNGMMRFQKQLKLNVVQVLKDAGLVTGREDIHRIALRL